MLSPLMYNSLPINDESLLLGELRNKKIQTVQSLCCASAGEGECQLMLSHNILLLLANHLSISTRNSSVKGHHV